MTLHTKKNYRHTSPKCCATCNYRIDFTYPYGEDIFFICARDLPFAEDLGWTFDAYLRKCDGYKKYDPLSKWRKLSIVEDKDAGLVTLWE